MHANSLVLAVVALLGTPVSAALPANWGVVVFPAFQAIDVFGPLDALNFLSRTRQMNLSIIAGTMDPVSTRTRHPPMNPFNSSFAQSIVPTHTFRNAPKLDVLLVPGGVGALAPDLDPLRDYIRRVFPSLQYVVGVCNGAGIMAEAGILDGKFATTNKILWADVIARGPNVKWVPEARWVVDGHIWTSSGVSAGIDVTLAFIDAIYGNQVGERIATQMEYVRHVDWRDDPFTHLIPGSNRTAPAR
jgi:transcriptional regulator GlxA family with amidase domain